MKKMKERKQQSNKPPVTRRQLGALTAAGPRWGPPHPLLREWQRGGHHPRALLEWGRRRKSHVFNSSSSFTPRAPIPCSGQQQVLMNPTLSQLKRAGRGRKALLLPSLHIWLSPGWPWGFRKPRGHVAVRAQPCAPDAHVLAGDTRTNTPPRGWTGLRARAAPSRPAVLLLAVIAAGLLIFFQAGNASSKRIRGGPPATSTNYTVFAGMKGSATSALFLPTSKRQQPIYLYFQAMFGLPWPWVPNSFFLPAVKSRFLTCHFSLL